MQEIEERSFKARFVEPYVFAQPGFVLEIMQQAPEHEGTGKDPLGTGATVWRGSIVLSEHIVSRQIPVQNKRVLEIGSGGGLGGLTAAACGAKLCILTDLEEMMPLLQKNTRRNNFVQTLSGAEVRLEILHWGDGSALAKLAPFDVIIAADVCYHEDHVGSLAATFLAGFEGNPDLQVYIVQERHEPMAWAALKKTLCDSGLTSCTMGQFASERQADRIDVVRFSKVAGEEVRGGGQSQDESCRAR